MFFSSVTVGHHCRATDWTGKTRGAQTHIRPSKWLKIPGEGSQSGTGGSAPLGLSGSPLTLTLQRFFVLLAETAKGRFL
jgi:hypothetical protein